MWLHCQGVVSGVFVIILEVQIHCFGTEISVRCLEFIRSRFSEVVNTWYFQSVTEALSALESVSASRSACFWRFDRIATR